ncbi:MAG: hypothetical protein ABFQ95_05305 [Pseudomonadota bacterium]
MYFCNHLYLVGRLEANVQAAFKNKHERLATFTLLTPIKGSNNERFFKYRVSVENPSLVEYAESCLIAGKLVFVLGQFEPDLDESGPAWVVISEDFGMLHPIGSHVHPSLPIPALHEET